MVTKVDYLDEPILNTPYLDDMREWVGDDVLATLLESAPAALKAEIVTLRTAWDRADLSEVRETGHRLKGAAGSVGCRRLAAMGHTIQMLGDLDDGRALDGLGAAVEDAESAIADYTAGLRG